MMKIMFIEVDPEDTEKVTSAFPDATNIDGKLQDDGILEQCKDAEVLSCFIYSKIGKAELDAMPKLKLICTRSVGYDHIDVAACRDRNITVCNVPDYGSHVIAEHVFALLLSATRHIREADARVESGNFDYRGLRGMALKGKTIGVVGTGKIGRKVCAIAHGFGMRVLACDRCRTIELEELLHVEYVDFTTILHESDILTLHAPATKETEHMINDGAIAHMKDDAVLINTARGSLIDTEALMNALENGKFSHVLLDVLEHEKNFEENKRLIGHDKVVTTPHIAFFADQSMQRMYEDTFESIRQFESGATPEHQVKPPNVVCDLPGVQQK